MVFSPSSMSPPALTINVLPSHACTSASFNPNSVNTVSIFIESPCIKFHNLLFALAVVMQWASFAYLLYLFVWFFDVYKSVAPQRSVSRCVWLRCHNNPLVFYIPLCGCVC